MKQRIFVIDDEQDILDILKINLVKEGFDVQCFLSTKAGMSAFERSLPDLILLDVMMENTDGYEFCRALKADGRYSRIPVIFVSAKSEEFDRVLGLELGADDYIVKPFGIKELVSRVRAVLRRYSPEKTESRVLSWRELSLFPDEYRLLISGKDIKLTKTEFGMLHLFLKNPGKIFSRDNIIDSVKGQDIYVVDRTIDVHIMNLRRKMGSYKKIIHTFSGVGYGFRETD